MWINPLSNYQFGRYKDLKRVKVQSLERPLTEGVKDRKSLPCLAKLSPCRDFFKAKPNKTKHFKGHFDLFYNANLFQKTLTLQTSRFFMFCCYILALKILHFLRLFSINFATTGHLFQIQIHKFKSFLLQKKVPSNFCTILFKIQSSSVHSYKTDTQTHPMFTISVKNLIVVYILLTQIK